MVLGIVKNARQQINYGTGRDVSDESLADATFEAAWSAFIIKQSYMGSNSVCR